jgi:hypothetical protein
VKEENKKKKNQITVKRIIDLLEHQGFLFHSKQISVKYCHIPTTNKNRRILYLHTFASFFDSIKDVLEA